jgi:molybdenum cofactor biosynthesis protein B
MVDSSSEHKADAPSAIGCAVITVSDTRTLDTDTGGREVVERLQGDGHRVIRREIIPDDPRAMLNLLAEFELDSAIDAVLPTGGTGITSRDQTYETVSSVLTKPLPGYGELFRMLSYEQIGAAAMLSRALGGLMQRTVVLTMPGSRKAVELAMEKVILPELGHLVREARR